MDFDQTNATFEALQKISDISFVSEDQQVSFRVVQNTKRGTFVTEIHLEDDESKPPIEFELLTSDMPIEDFKQVHFAAKDSELTLVDENKNVLFKFVFSLPSNIKFMYSCYEDEMLVVTGRYSFVICEERFTPLYPDAYSLVED